MKPQIVQLRCWLVLLSLAASLQITLGYYDPAAQRWINRDPIGETGGANLYRAAANNPITRIDAHGQRDGEGTWCRPDRGPGHPDPDAPGGIWDDNRKNPTGPPCSISACRGMCAAAATLGVIWGCDALLEPRMKQICKTAMLAGGGLCAWLCNACGLP